MPIDAHSFLKAFDEVWQTRVVSDRARCAAVYLNSTIWTQEMCGDGGILMEVSKVLQAVETHRFGREWYTLDAVLVGGSDLFRSGLNYPSRLFAVIEHENGENVEEEMWKLIHWRSPLKVLIFYGWPDFANPKSSRKVWAEKKLKVLRNMAAVVEHFNPESVQTEYLFLMGSRAKGEDVPNWFWASNAQKLWRPLPEHFA